MKSPVTRFPSFVMPLLLTAVFAAGCASQPAQETGSADVAQTRPAQSTTPAEARAAAMMSYTVVRGDHLWGISGKPTIYGNPYQWPLIFKANRDKIRDADLIEPGQVFSIEKNPSGADINAAVNHARTRGAWSLGATERSDLDYLRLYGIN
jgi:LysM repeat protein